MELIYVYKFITHSSIANKTNNSKNNKNAEPIIISQPSIEYLIDKANIFLLQSY